MKPVELGGGDSHRFAVKLVNKQPPKCKVFSSDDPEKLLVLNTWNIRFSAVEGRSETSWMLHEYIKLISRNNNAMSIIQILQSILNKYRHEVTFRSISHEFLSVCSMYSALCQNRQFKKCHRKLVFQSLVIMFLIGCHIQWTLCLNCLNSTLSYWDCITIHCSCFSHWALHAVGLVPALILFNKYRCEFALQHYLLVYFSLGAPCNEPCARVVLF